MVGTIELDRDGRTLLIRFPYREDLVDEVRTLPGRRWDRGAKVWRVPTAHAEDVVSTFMKHGFTVSSDVTGVLAGTQGLLEAPSPEGAAEAEPARADAPNAPLSISALNELVRAAVQRAFPERVQVVGEVSDFDKIQGRRHLFFTLVEKDDGGQKARVEVALFAGTATRLLPELERQGLTMRDGIEILVEARVDLYPASGRYQLVIETIRPEFTLGQLAMTREKILERLHAQRIDRLQLALELPRPARRVAVLTSPDSDGWHDFRQELGRSGAGFELDLYPVRVQGAELRSTMLAGLRWFDERSADYDVLCIVRGGGSRTDLAWFDDADLAEAVARHPLKVLCGIGHHRDQSVLDVIAHSEKTPTAVATYLVGARRAVHDDLVERSRQLQALSRSALASADAILSEATIALGRALDLRLAGSRRALVSAGHRLAAGTRARLRDAGERLRRRVERVSSGSRAAIARDSERLALVCDRICRGAVHALERDRARLDAAAARRRLLDPVRVLERGYAIVRDAASGRIVTRASELEPGQIAELGLRDGSARARVESIELDPKIHRRTDESEDDGSP